MPTISDRPRSAGGTPRSGTVSDRPRSASGGSSTRARTSSAPRGLTVGGRTFGSSDVTRRIAQAADRNVGAGPAFTPVRALLDAASTPAYVIGNLVAGRPGEAARNLYTVGQSGRKTFVSDALRERGMLPGGTLGTILGLGLDVVTDPTTYATLGGAAAARTAGAGASRMLTEAARQAAREGKRVPISTAARAAAMREAELARIPPAVSIGFRVPLTRGKVIPVAESKLLARAGQRVARTIGDTRIGENLREVFLPAGAGSKQAHRIGMASRRAGEAEKRVISRQAAAFQREVARTAKREGVDLSDAYRGLTKYLDAPDRNPLPDAFKGLSEDARAFLDDLRRLEDEAGVERGLVPDYVPHLPASGRERRKYERMFDVPPGSPLFFQKERTLPDLDAWEAAGLRPEYNLARLLEVRGHASVDARVMRAFEESVSDLDLAAPDVRRVLEQVRPAMSSNYAVEDAKRFVNAVGSSWKALALTSPGYHMRNLQSDLLSAYWAGARNPTSYLQAVRVLRGKGGPVTIRGQKYTPQELVALAESSGAIRLGQAGREIRGELAEAGGEKVRRPGVRPSRPGQGKIARGSQAVGEAREDMVRLGTFIERLKAGDDALTAAQRTRDFLYDYGDVGRFVRAARRFWLPFITFPTKAVPMLGRVAVQRPGTLANLNKSINALNQAAGDPDMSLLPLGQRSSFAVPAPQLLRRIIGAPQGQPLLFNPEQVLAYGALNQFDPTNVTRSAGGLLNPIPKSLIEGGTDYSFYFGGRQGDRVKAPAVINALARLGVPIPNYGPKPVSYPPGSPPVPGYWRNLDLALRIFPPFSQSAGLIPGGGTETTRLPYLRYFGGVSISPYDAAREAYFAQRYGRR